MVKRLLARLSICPCGYSVLHDHIQIGAEYEVGTETIECGVSYECGKCGKVQSNVRLIKASSISNPIARASFLPAVLFDL